MSMWSPRARRGVLFVIACVCLIAGGASLYGSGRPTPVRDGSTSVALLLGLVLLPGATLAARRAERKLRSAAKVTAASAVRPRVQQG